MVWHSPLPEPSTTGWHRLATSHLLLMYQRGFDMFLHGERPLFREERSGKGWVYGVWMLVQAVEHFPSASIWRGLWESSDRSLPMAFWHLFFGFLAVSLDLRGFWVRTNHRRVHGPLFSGTLSKLCFFVCRPLPRPPPPWPPPSLPRQRPTRGLSTVSGHASVRSPHLGAR